MSSLDVRKRTRRGNNSTSRKDVANGIKLFGQQFLGKTNQF